MILPQGYQNLFVIGRAAAADREASASSRVFGPCSVMGQAAGTAAALALEGNLASVRDVDLPTLRGCLQDQGAII